MLVDYGVQPRSSGASLRCDATVHCRESPLQQPKAPTERERKREIVQSKAHEIVAQDANTYRCTCMVHAYVNIIQRRWLG